MSTVVSPKEVEDFSHLFEQDLEFVCMVGLASEKNEAAKEMVEYLGDKEIKMCVFTNNLTEVQSLKTLFEKRGKEGYVDLEGRAVEEITYNLNMITRKLNYEREYGFSLVLGAECWRLLKVHSSLMQHFLFAAYYANNILTHGFTPS